jgi:phosphoglycerate dehydrogenase-like enzyme
MESTSRHVEILPFTSAIELTPAQLESIDAAFYSRDIWNGTVKEVLSPASQRFWRFVDAAPNLKWIQLVSAGADHRHYRRCAERAVRLTTSAGTNAEPVALNAVTGLLMIARGFLHWTRAQQKREWAPLGDPESARDLRGQTAVIIGTGHIGTAIARNLKANGVRTIGLRRRIVSTEHFDEVLPLSALDNLLQKCDWLVLACPLTPETRRLIDARRLALLPSHAGFVNVARGEVVDEGALIHALAGERLRGAYLDVFAVEPLPADSPLWHLQNVIMTPHDATSSVGNYARGVELFLRNLESYLRGHKLENEVQTPLHD